jgi:hypothetical protein
MQFLFRQCNCTNAHVPRAGRSRSGKSYFLSERKLKSLATFLLNLREQDCKKKKKQVFFWFGKKKKRKRRKKHTVLIVLASGFVNLFKSVCNKCSSQSVSMAFFNCLIVADFNPFGISRF